MNEVQGEPERRSRGRALRLGGAARGLAALVGAALLLGPAQAEPAKHDLKALLPDGRILHFVCSGQGSPTIIFDSGFGATSQAWGKVQPALSRDQRACSYDRAGSGLSDPGPFPRDGAAIAKDLDQGLRAAKIGGPYVLVGHSAAGLYLQIFAARRMRDVKGMVLVDPSVPYQDKRFADLAASAGNLAPLRERAQTCAEYLEGRINLADPKQQSRCLSTAAGARGAAYWRSQVSELDSLWGATSDEVPKGPHALDAMPLIVLTAGKTGGPPNDPTLQAYLARWRDLHRETAARSSQGVERLVPDASHMIMLQKPDVVIAAVEEVVAKVRKAHR
jgi:pimeloyl-ACP methyl ester carboxylesterase